MEQLPRWTKTGPSTPSPGLFRPDEDHDTERRVELTGRALDDVVEAFLRVADLGHDAKVADIWRLVAASRRLWALANALYRARRRLP